MDEVTKKNMQAGGIDEERKDAGEKNCGCSCSEHKHDVRAVDGPHLSSPSESGNRSQDEGKIYDV